MNNHRQRKPNPEAAKDRGERNLSPFAPSAAPFMKLQRTIGNHALQRMLVVETSSRAIQRDHNENAKPADNQKSRFMALLTVTIDGKKLKGTSKISGHEEAIELLNLSRGTGMPNNQHREEETPQYEYLDLIKNIDGTSTAILDAAAKGTPITFKLVVGKVDNEGKFTSSITIESDDAIFSSYNSSSGGGDATIESFSISYRPPKKEK